MMKSGYTLGNFIVRNADGATGGAAATLASPDGNAGAPPPTASDTGAAADTPWYADIPQEYHQTIVAKGWKSPAEAVQSYANLESLFGHDRAGNTVAVPKADAPPEEKRAYLAKLGIPEKAEDYGFKAPDGMPELPIYSEAAKWFQKAGVPKELAGSIFKEFMQAEKTASEQLAQMAEKDMADLAKEWGNDFDNKLELGKRAARTLGFDGDKLSAIERAVGTKTLMEAMVRVGEKLLEAPAPDGSTGNNGFTTSAQSAKTEIARLQNDSEFMARYNSPNMKIRQSAIDHMNKLFEIAAK